jgi:hypothetical protein
MKEWYNSVHVLVVSATSNNTRHEHQTLLDYVYLNIFTLLSRPSFSLCFTDAQINQFDISDNFLVPTSQASLSPVDMSHQDHYKTNFHTHTTTTTTHLIQSDFWYPFILLFYYPLFRSNIINSGLMADQNHNNHIRL